MPEATVELRGITKGFPGVMANENVDFTAYRGEIHALLGENGAGKSTLMNILAGLYRPDSGDILIEGKKQDFHRPADAISAGIGMIHQHFKLVDNFTVAENVALGHEKTGFLVNKKKMAQDIAAVATANALELDMNAYVWQLSVGEQQRVEILKMLYRNARILVLDEPTAVLTPQESTRLFDTLREMARNGCTIIIITHKLAEVCDVADRVTVMRRGKLSGAAQGEEINYQNLTSMMMNENIKIDANVPRGTPGEDVLCVKDLRVLGVKGTVAVDEISFSLRAGEILGVAGVAGNGQRELTEAICGLRPAEQGTLTFNGRDMTRESVRRRIDEGLAFVPEDRLGTGLVGNMNMADNLLLRTYWSKEAGKGMNIDYSKVNAKVDEAIAEYDIAVGNKKAPVRLMSGGNLQKVVLARELSLEPKAIVAAYPVRGLDIGAMEMIYNLLVSERDRGAGVLMLSEDLDALLKYSDRIMVLYRGRVMGIMDKAEARIGRIGMMMMGTTPEEVAKIEAVSHV
ncbi:MAG: ABC transporter ATP-binding protein [Eubacteriales bacterium]|nr:ABC transporter ATP-binding protein [Eubacteriales bacterium]